MRSQPPFLDLRVPSPDSRQWTLTFLKGPRGPHGPFSQFPQWRRFGSEPCSDGFLARVDPSDPIEEDKEFIVSFFPVLALLLSADAQGGFF